MEESRYERKRERVPERARVLDGLIGHISRI